MKIALNILGGLMIAFGTTWFLQGINILPGSFKTGDLHWPVFGGIAVIVGLAVLLKAHRLPLKS